jgi:hypothetical protein
MGDGVEVEPALLLRHAGVEDDLEEQIAQLVLEVRHVAARDRVGDLIGLLDRAGGDGGEILLHVPGAAAVGIAQRRHHGEQPVDPGAVGGRGVLRHRKTCSLRGTSRIRAGSAPP